MPLPGHHSWCNSTVPAPIASCCQKDAVEAEKLVDSIIWSMKLHDPTYEPSKEVKFEMINQVLAYKDKYNE